MLADLPSPLSEEQAKAARALALDGQGVSVLQALAGTGKTRVLGALARIYEAAGHGVLGVAPTGRAARELGASAGIRAFTIHRLLPELEQSGSFAPSTVVLFDEAGTAPTRPSAALFALAEHAGAKMIVVGDSGQLPSVAAGGWFAAIADRIGGPELRQVMRQRDPAEREALEALHDGDPEQYLELKRDQGTLTVQLREHDSIAAILADWNGARRQHGLNQAVMIARGNATRTLLNDRARELLVREGTIAADGTDDRRPRVPRRKIDHRTGALTVITDSGQQPQLDAAYAAEHFAHAYALTGHGATVEWAGVIGRPSEFTREWAYTSLSRAREHTRVHLIAEATAGQLEREQYAPPEPERSTAEAFEIMTRAMRRREAESLALDQAEPADISHRDTSLAAQVPLAEPMEAGAERAGANALPAPEPDWRSVRNARERGGSRGLER